MSEKKEPTTTEAMFFFAIVKHTKNKADIDWTGVADEVGFKNAEVAKVRFGQVKRKLGINSNVESPSKRTPTKVTKSTSTPRKGGGRKAAAATMKKEQKEESSEGDDDDEDAREAQNTPSRPAIKKEVKVEVLEDLGDQGHIGGEMFPDIFAADAQLQMDINRSYR